MTTSTTPIQDKLVVAPTIADEQIRQMLHIQQVERHPAHDLTFRKLVNHNHVLDPRKDSCEYGNTRKRAGSFLITLADMYAWMRFFYPDDWHRIKYFCIFHTTLVAKGLYNVYECILIFEEDTEHCAVCGERAHDHTHGNPRICMPCSTKCDDPQCSTSAGIHESDEADGSPERPWLLTHGHGGYWKHSCSRCARAAEIRDDVPFSSYCLSFSPC